MRILLLHNIVNPHMTPVFRHLARKPDVDLQVAYFAASEGDRTWRPEVGDGFTSSVLDGRQLSLFRPWDTLSFHLNLGVRRFLRSTSWDVLINAGWASPTNWLAFQECRKQGKPHVLWAGSTEHEHSFRRTLALPAVRYLVRRSQAFVSYGGASKEYLEQLGAPGDRVFPSFHCIDNERFLGAYRQAGPQAAALRARLGIEGKRVVLFMGRLVERKGGIDLLRAHARLERRFRDLVLVFVGDGPARPHWQAEAQRLGLASAVFVGGVDFSDRAAYYTVAQLFVLPSREEVWGLVLNEAALASLPLVATSCCGAAEDLIADGVNGYRVPPGDIGALADAISEVLSDPKRARAMGEASARMIERFTPEGVAGALHRAAELAIDTGLDGLCTAVRRQ